MRTQKVFLLATLFSVALYFSNQPSVKYSDDGATQTGGLVLKDDGGTRTGGVHSALVVSSNDKGNGIISSGTKEGGIVSYGSGTQTGGLFSELIAYGKHTENGIYSNLTALGKGVGNGFMVSGDKEGGLA